MGVAQGVPANNQNKNVSDEDQLRNGILQMASQLYKQYYPKMNDVTLCQNIGLVAADKLEQFDTFTLKQVSNRQNSGEVTLRPVFVSKNSNQGEMFEIERMPELPDYFSNKYISIPDGLDNKGRKFNVSYLSNQILNILKHGDTKRDNRRDTRKDNRRDTIKDNRQGNIRKDDRKRFKKFKKRRFRGGTVEGLPEGRVEIVKPINVSKKPESILTEDALLKELGNFEKQLQQIKQDNKQNRPARQNQPNKQNRPARQNQPQKSPNKQNRQPQKPPNRNNRRKEEPKLEEKEADDSDNENNENNDNENNDNENNDNENNDNENNEDDEEDDEDEEDEENKNLKKALGMIKEKIRNVNKNAKKNIKNVNTSLPVVIKNVVKPEETGKNKNKNVYRKKKISKRDLCKLIAHHYMVRANLVAAIASALPLSNNPGFCQSRISALERGELCLPPDYEAVQALPMLKASNILSKYVNNFNHGACKSVNGYYKRHNSEKMLKIQEGNTELQQRYVKHVQKMKKDYIDSLATLKEILDELTTNPGMTNADLKILSEKSKETLDEMYTNCQYDYILGVIALLQIDYQLPRISTDSMNNLKAALAERTK